MCRYYGSNGEIDRGKQEAFGAKMPHISDLRRNHARANDVSRRVWRRRNQVLLGSQGHREYRGRDRSPPPSGAPPPGAATPAPVRGRSIRSGSRPLSGADVPVARNAAASTATVRSPPRSAGVAGGASWCRSSTGRRSRNRQPWGARVRERCCAHRSYDCGSGSSTSASSHASLRSYAKRSVATAGETHAGRSQGRLVTRVNAWTTASCEVAGACPGEITAGWTMRTR